MVRHSIWIICCIVLAACGGGGGSDSGGTGTAVAIPSAPQNVAANAGDTTLSLAWQAPATGGAVSDYALTLSPAVASSDVIVNGTSAWVRGLVNGTTYSVTVAARNASGTGAPSAAVSVVPGAASASRYQAIAVQGDNSPSGIFDPSVITASDGSIWMSYSSVNYYNDANSRLVQDVGIRTARSADKGVTFTYVSTVADPAAATVTDTTGINLCGSTTCAGRWVYETSWLVDDATDPDGSRRFKIFAHKYFLYPPHTPATIYTLGSIALWTAPALAGPWTVQTPVIGWNMTPPEATAQTNVNAIDPSLASCLAVQEGSASVRAGTIDFAFACTYPANGTLPQKIVMLRSTDHAATFKYVSTLLQPSDNASLPAGTQYFSAPALFAANDGAPVLFVTPIAQGSGFYAGCVIYPFADVAAGTLIRNNSLPLPLLGINPIAGHIGGACAGNRSMTGSGILLNDASVTNNVVQFRILATHVNL